MPSSLIAANSAKHSETAAFAPAAEPPDDKNSWERRGGALGDIPEEVAIRPEVQVFPATPPPRAELAAGRLQHGIAALVEGRLACERLPVTEATFRPTGEPAKDR